LEGRGEGSTWAMVRDRDQKFGICFGWGAPSRGGQKSPAWTTKTKKFHLSLEKKKGEKKRGEKHCRLMGEVRTVTGESASGEKKTKKKKNRKKKKEKNQKPPKKTKDALEKGAKPRRIGLKR